MLERICLTSLVLVLFTFKGILTSTLFTINLISFISTQDIHYVFFCQMSLFSLFFCVCLVAQSCPTLCDTWTVACPAPWSMGILQARVLEWVAICSFRGPCIPGIEQRSPALQVDSLPSKPPWKPMNTGVGSHSLLQGIFPTQESNRGLLHCRQIHYQLSYQGSPILSISIN